MKKYHEVKEEIDNRVIEHTRILTDHYTREVEQSFSKAIDDVAVEFPICFAVPIHAADAHKKGANIIHALMKKHDYRSVQISYDTNGAISIKVHVNGTVIARTCSEQFR